MSLIRNLWGGFSTWRARSLTLEKSSAANFLSMARTLFESPWYAYGMLLLLQVHVLWGIWAMKDLTGGDSCMHYLPAYSWHNEGRLNPVWSPLYSLFLGSLMYITTDPVQITLLLRVVILVISSVLILAISRHLLPKILAWAVAAWWVVLPINFNSLYELHLFATIPLLVMWFVLMWNTRWARGSALGILALSALTVRNEIAPAVFLFSLACAIREWRAIRESSESRSRQAINLLAPYGIPLAAVAALSVYIVTHSLIPPSEIPERFRVKNTFNVGQGFAYGYKQRHPEWEKNAWLDYRELMKEQFGREDVTLAQLAKLNPNAALEHFLWNCKLTPAGLQVLLFNTSSSELEPDYIPVRKGRRWAAIATAALLILWGAGSILMLKQWRFWWDFWLSERAMLWMGMLSVAACAPIIILSMRPRPSFLLNLSLPLMAFTGMCLFVVLQQSQRLSRLAQWTPHLAGAATLVLVAWVPSFFTHHHFHVDQKPYLALEILVRRLSPYADVFADPRPIMLPVEFCGEVRAYVGKCRHPALPYESLKDNWPRGVSLEQYLQQNDIFAIYLNNEFLKWLEAERPEDSRAFRDGAVAPGWELMGSSAQEYDSWAIYKCVQ